MITILFSKHICQIKIMHSQNIHSRKEKYEKAGREDLTLDRPPHEGDVVGSVTLTCPLVLKGLKSGLAAFIN